MTIPTPRDQGDEPAMGNEEYPMMRRAKSSRSQKPREESICRSKKVSNLVASNTCNVMLISDLNLEFFDNYYKNSGRNN